MGFGWVIDYFLLRDGKLLIRTGSGRCGNLEVQNILPGNEQSPGQTAPVTVADIRECSMGVVKLIQEFLGTHNIHIREMFCIIWEMV